jgi:hypothetical protein
VLAAALEWLYTHRYGTSSLAGASSLTSRVAVHVGLLRSFLISSLGSLLPSSSRVLNGRCHRALEL